MRGEANRAYFGAVYEAYAPLSLREGTNASVFLRCVGENAKEGVLCQPLGSLPDGHTLTLPSR